MNRREFLLAGAGLTIAALAWLFPFHPVGPSPFGGRREDPPEREPGPTPEPTPEASPSPGEPAATPPAPPLEEKPAAPAVSGPTGNILNVQAEHNSWAGGVLGMLIHVNFTVQGATQEQCQAVAYFSFASGEPLKDFNGQYTTQDQQVSVGQPFVPVYPGAVFNDLQLFMPYQELHMSPGAYDLRFQVRLYHQPTGTFFADSQFVPFQYSS